MSVRLSWAMDGREASGTHGLGKQEPLNPFGDEDAADHEADEDDRRMRMGPKHTDQTFRLPGRPQRRRL